MSYKGTTDVAGLPELESVRRLRESGLLPQAVGTVEGGPGSGPHKGAGHAGKSTPSAGAKPQWGARSSKAKAAGVTRKHLEQLRDLHDNAMQDAKDEAKGDNDKEMISMYKGDARDYNKLHNMLAAGNIRGASNKLDNMDSAPRDEFDGRGIKGLGYDEEDDD